MLGFRGGGTGGHQRSVEMDSIGLQFTVRRTPQRTAKSGDSFSGAGKCGIGGGALWARQAG